MRLRRKAWDYKREAQFRFSIKDRNNIFELQANGRRMFTGRYRIIWCKSIRYTATLYLERAEDAVVLRLHYPEDSRTY